MKSMDHQVLILSSVCHIMGRLKQIEARLDSLDESTSDILEYVAPPPEEDQIDDEADPLALADQLLDAADEIEDADMVPKPEIVAAQLREIAKELQG